MDPEQLWETTLDPERRVLKQVEIEDARMASEITGNAQLGAAMCRQEDSLSTNTQTKQKLMHKGEYHGGKDY